jgi:hypothetical protein
LGYVNAHGTSPPAGDVEEARAIARIYPHGRQRLHVSSTKSMTGQMSSFVDIRIFEKLARDACEGVAWAGHAIHLRDSGDLGAERADDMVSVRESGHAALFELFENRPRMLVNEHSCFGRAIRHGAQENRVTFLVPIGKEGNVREKNDSAVGHGKWISQACGGRTKFSHPILKNAPKSRTLIESKPGKNLSEL